MVIQELAQGLYAFIDYPVGEPDTLLSLVFPLPLVVNLFVLMHRVV